MEAEQFLPIRHRLIPETRTPLFLVFGAGGHTVYLSKECRIAGYHGVNNFMIPSKFRSDTFREVENPRLYEGVPWCDMTHLAKTDEGVELTFKGPRLDVGLANGLRRDLKGALSGVPVPGSTFEARVALLMEHLETGIRKRAGAYTEVSPEEYCAGWKLLGAYVGTIQAGCFVEMNDPPDSSIAMRGVRVWMSGGDYVETSINGSRREIYDYYIGNYFEGLGTALSVEFLPILGEE